MEIEGYEDYIIFKSGEIWSTKSNKYMTPFRSKWDVDLIRLTKNFKATTFRIDELLYKHHKIIYNRSMLILIKKSNILYN